MSDYIVDHSFCGTILSVNVEDARDPENAIQRALVLIKKHGVLDHHVMKAPRANRVNF